jgi:hypothetical protein
MKSYLYALLSGLIFSAGLGISGMTQQGKVLGFLNLGGPWDPSLALVMLGATLVHGVGFRLVMHLRKAPLVESRFQLPTSRTLDGKLLGGAALFGVGWGLGGFCPGPGLVTAATGSPAALTFVATMTLGMLLEHAQSARTSVGTTPPPPAPPPTA